VKLYNGRAKVIFVILVLLFAVLEIRLFYVQVIRGKYYTSLIEKQTKRRIILEPLRGMILDREGRILARALHRKAEVLVAEDSSTVSVNRLYPYGEAGAHLLGMVGADGTGLAGIEFSSDSLLKGEPGWTIKRVDGKRHRYGSVRAQGEPAVDGSHVYLTIDIEVQKILERSLEKAVFDNSAKNAMGIVMDPSTGEIIAMASSPGYNANYWWKSPQEQRRNRVSGYNYEPGSTMKVLTLASALNEKLFDPTDSIDGNNGRLEVYKQVITDHTPRGRMSLSEALWYSSNIAFAKIADSLGQKRMYSYCRDYGFGSPTGVALAGEEKGTLNPLDKWSGRTALTIGFGHEINTTLLQMTTAYCAIANGGYLLRPQIIRRYSTDAGTVREISRKEVIRSVISPEVALTVRRMMEGVVVKGTAKKGRVESVPIAGKTGTSLKIDPITKRYSSSKQWASFIAMAPIEKPAIVVAIVVDEPENAAASNGGDAAAPAVAEVIRKIIATPNLSIGEGIMTPKNGIDSVGAVKPRIAKYPKVIGTTRREAIRMCKAVDVPYEFVGDGEFITHQSPDAGSEVIEKTPVLLYTDKLIGKGVNEKNSVMPNCVGRTMKDAINALSIKGLKPTFVGYGKVTRQVPSAGLVIPTSAPCTLFCDLREAL